MARTDAIVTFAFYVVFAALYIIGFSVPYWAIDGSESFGLWQVCEEVLCSQWNNLNLLADMQACQAMASLGLFTLLPALIGHVIWLAYPVDKHAMAGAWAAAASNLTAGVFGGVALTVFGVQYAKESTTIPNGWGFWVSLAACACLILLGCITLCWFCADAPESPSCDTHMKPSTQQPSAIVVQDANGTAQYAYTNQGFVDPPPPYSSQ